MIRSMIVCGRIPPLRVPRAETIRQPQAEGVDERKFFKMVYSLILRQDAASYLTLAGRERGQRAMLPLRVSRAETIRQPPAEGVDERKFMG